MPLPLKQILLAGPDDAALAISAKASSQNSLGWMVSTVDSGSEALAVLDQTSFDLVTASMALPGMSGLDLLRATMVRHPHTVRVLLLDRPQPEFILNAVGIVHQYLVKPCASDDLLATVCRLLAAGAEDPDGRGRRVRDGGRGIHGRRPLVVQIDEFYIHALHLIDRIDRWEDVADRL